MKTFEDKVVVITGGATGIGFSLAKRIGQEGARIVIAARRKDRLEEAVAKLAVIGIDATYKECDVARLADVEALADYAWERHGRVDAIINNAGIPPLISTAIDARFEDIARVFRVNVYGAWNGVSVFGKRFLQAKRPAGIYTVGSENSLFNGVPGGSAYIAGKHALLGMMDALRIEVPDYIHVGLICPGFVKSEIGENMDLAMDTDRFTAMVTEQMKAGAFYIVSHAHNMVHIDKRYQEIAGAYKKFAPRYDGDEEFDVWSIGANAGQSILGPQ